MGPYEKVLPGSEHCSILWSPTTNLTVSHVCPTVHSPRTILQALTVNCRIKLSFSYYLVIPPERRALGIEPARQNRADDLHI